MVFQCLDEKVAWIKGKPIHKAQDMVSGKEVSVKKIDAEWENRIKDKWWYHKNTEVPVGVYEGMFLLRDRLLSFGGSEACLALYEPDLGNIMERGQLWYNDRSIKVKGEPNACHRNSAKFWKKHTDEVVICTGYALSRDGMWRQHTWMVQETNGHPKIYETTEKRVLYYGFALNNAEAETFYEENA